MKKQPKYNPGRLEDVRTDCFLKKTEMARLLGVDRSTYDRYAKGETDIPLSKLIAFAEKYNYSLDYIAGRSKNERVANPIEPRFKPYELFVFADDEPMVADKNKK